MQRVAFVFILAGVASIQFSSFKALTFFKEVNCPGSTVIFRESGEHHHLKSHDVNYEQELLSAGSLGLYTIEYFPDTGVKKMCQ